MRRVSSRPRLFSWDQFDATADSSEGTTGSEPLDRIQSPSNTGPISSEDPNTTSISNNNNDDSSEYLEYMSCYSISTAKEISRSTSMLSLSKFTAHGYADDIDSDDEDHDYYGDGVSVSFSPTPSAPLLAPLIDEPPPISISVASNSNGITSGKKRSVDGTYVNGGGGMHKSVSFSNLVQIHPSGISKISPSSSPSSSEAGRLQLLNLQEDMQIQCLAFLNLKELQKLEVTCRYFKTFLRHSSAGIRNGIWWNVMKDMFPYLSLHDEQDHHEMGQEHSSGMTTTTTALSLRSPGSVQFVNHACDGIAKEIQNKNIHYGALLSQASSQTPSAIDDYYFKTTELSPVLALDRRNNISPTNRLLFERLLALSGDLGGFRRYDLQMPDRSTRTVTQYIGQIGVGDRSIRSDHPFPRPHATSTNILNISSIIPQGLVGKLKREGGEGSPGAGLNLLDRLRTCHRHCHSVGAVDHTASYSNQLHASSARVMKEKAFVSPFLSKVDQHRVEIDLTPRMMAYFEVSILPRDETQESKSVPPNATDMDQELERLRLHQLQRPRNAAINPCVAVGLSIRGFSDKSRMPGWDVFSYGYHGDDGGIFHSQGNMIRVYGPTYKEGDTVGCGVNYQNGGIFYTLNGDFLGYAWMNEKNVMEGKVDLFPTVGVDTNNPLDCNFGTRPFVFDFSDFVQQNGSNPSK